MYRVLGHAADHQQWLDLRRKGIGGSDASAILGIDPFRTPMEVWEDKRSKTPAKQETTPAIEFGALAEDYILGRLNEEHYSYIVHEGASLGTLQHTRRTWQLANVDGYLPELNVGLEIKTCDLNTKSYWQDGVPAYYYAQVQHYLAVTGWNHFDVWLLVCPMDRANVLSMYREFCLPDEFIRTLIGTSELCRFVVERDEDYIRRLNTAEYRFWEAVTSGRQPPVPPKTVRIGVDDDLCHLVKAFDASREKEREHRAARKAHQDQIIRLMASATRATLPNGHLDVCQGDWGKYLKLYKKCK